jgi:hypothetical protein
MYSCLRARRCPRQCRAPPAAAGPQVRSSAAYWSGTSMQPARRTHERTHTCTHARTCTQQQVHTDAALRRGNDSQLVHRTQLRSAPPTNSMCGALCLRLRMHADGAARQSAQRGEPRPCPSNALCTTGRAQAWRPSTHQHLNCRRLLVCQRIQVLGDAGCCVAPPAQDVRLLSCREIAAACGQAVVQLCLRTSQPRGAWKGGWVQWMCSMAATLMHPRLPQELLAVAGAAS